ncbi:MAG TPA: cell division protein FtsZ [Muribaculum sp.]|jgi:cell division protein FtsZ|uniref:Cell division protein FtsZ n=2 Tax=Heminiphilus faecis TaxID=2601703 RepID=A0ABV4CW44_9BACT|nr:cell division protein FtsZ [Heminiphilus faecis]HRF69362.1 cell division protein FtsZ [Muribaculum sp.]
MNESMEDNIPLMSDAGFNVDRASEPIIKVIGVGGGGSNAVNHMYKQDIENVSFVILNTDRQALEHLAVPSKVQIGDGLGAGNKPEKARIAAEDAADRIAELFNDNTKMVFITGGMGGGTGTGAAPVVARIAHEKGILTVGIVTIPFLFEGLNKIRKAYIGVEEMSKYVDALLVVNNQRLIEIYPDFTFDNAFDKADDTLTTAARSISEIITTKGKINLDFKDVETTLRDGGVAIISSGYGEGEHRVTKAIEDALCSPLLRNTDILSSKKLLFNLYYNPDAQSPLTAGETNELTTFINSINEEVDVIWGTAYDPALEERVKITILAAGFDSSDEESKPSRTVHFGGKKDAAEDNSDIARDYGTKALDLVKDSKGKARYIVMLPNQMDDDRFIEAFEKSPTFNREKKVAEEIKNIGHVTAVTNTGTTGNDNKTSAPSGGGTIRFFMDPDCYGLD